MKLGVQWPMMIHREGPDAIARLARDIEEIGYDEIYIWDHVAQGFPVPGRPGGDSYSVGPDEVKPRAVVQRPEEGSYPTKMPVMESLTTLAFLAGVTRRIGLVTHVLVLPQRQPLLVAKQLSTLDVLSGGRLTRVGLGLGWHPPEFQAMGVDFGKRAEIMEEAIPFLRRCWTQESISFHGDHIQVEAMAMEPKPVQAGGPSLWMGGFARPALRRCARFCDGWMGGGWYTREIAATGIAAVRRYLEEAGRDADGFGFQVNLGQQPHKDQTEWRHYYDVPDRVVAAATEAAELGYDHIGVPGTAVFISGARTGARMAEAFAFLHDHLRRAVGH